MPEPHPDSSVPDASAAPGLVLQTRPSMRSFAGTYFWLTILGMVLVAAGLLSGIAIPLFVLVLVGLLLPAAGLVYGWLVSLGSEYRVFEDSLEVQSGILSRNIDNIQLFRMRDLGLSQSIAGRLLNYGDITITSTDPSAPHFVLRGVPDPRRVYESLRRLVARSQAMRRTMILEQEPPSAAGGC